MYVGVQKDGPRWFQRCQVWALAPTGTTERITTVRQMSRAGTIRRTHFPQMLQWWAPWQHEMLDSELYKWRGDSRNAATRKKLLKRKMQNLHRSKKIQAIIYSRNIESCLVAFTASSQLVSAQKDRAACEAEPWNHITGGCCTQWFVQLWPTSFWNASHD